MAKSHASLLAAAIALPFTLIVAGCQSNQSMVDHVPSPSFNGPTVQSGGGGGSAAPATPQVAQQAPPWTPPRIAPGKSSAGIPRDWVPYASARPWKWIVIHHSATPSGSARSFDRMHREKGWDELGYHFVIGNGTESGDGQIEVGPRWPKQKWGAHAKTPNNEFNDYGIGICLVGNFDIERPTAAQMRSLAKLVAYLEKNYRVPASRVLGHSDTKPTDCPGRNLSVATVRRMASQALADSGETVEDTRTASSSEFLEEKQSK
jgi:hypothetical protein